MPKARVKEILKYAQEHKFGVAAVNTLNIETARYIIEAAQRERVPVIVQFYPGFSDYTDLNIWLLPPAIWRRRLPCRWGCIWTILQTTRLQ